MRVEGDYARDGFATLRGLVPAEVAQAFLSQLKADLDAAGTSMVSLYRPAPIMNKSAVELYGGDYKPMLGFLWALTPTICEATGKDLLPTYNFFRIYREAAVCRVHSDRPACEHSLSLTLAYSDARPWPFEIGSEPIDEPGGIESTFEGAPHASISMQPGDAVLYRGIDYRHGRVSPNPNRWSAHMFLHWVDRNGPHADEAFDARARPLSDTPVDFDLP